jgi:tRNA dimethylallyltransferase
MVRQVLVVTGPTASGKTDVAIDLQRLLGGTSATRLISVDSTMIYTGMDVGTAKPDAEVLANHPHSLIDIRDPAQAYSAADFVADADAAVQAALAAEQIPILVGGTMMYHRRFREGIAQLPAADPDLRADLSQQLLERGKQAMHDELAAVDPTAAAKIHPHNTQRLIRALEVFRLSGVPMSQQWQEQATAEERLGVCLATFVLPSADRAKLHEQIAQRFDAMVRDGFLEEVRALQARDDLSPALPSMRAVGYRQAWQHLKGEITQAEFRDQAIAATRQLAKRQLTWLRGWQASWQDLFNLNGASAPQLAEQIGTLLNR